MLGNIIKRTRRSSPRVTQDENHARFDWITKSFVIKMVLIVALVGPAVSALTFPFVDQMIRNKVDDWMSVPDLFDSISIAPEEYAQLPPYWRQALAEIALRPRQEAIDAQNIIEGLKLADIRLIDLVAPYATSAGILRHQDQLNFKSENQEIQNSLEVTAFTSGGKQLVEALRVPSNIAYFEWFARDLEERGFSAELLVAGTRENQLSEEYEVQGVIDRYSIPEWPP